MNDIELLKDKINHFKSKLEDKEQENKLLQVKLEGKKSIIGWGVGLIIVLLLILLFNTGSEQVINNGYTLEQVTNATIQVCQALK